MEKYPSIFRKNSRTKKIPKYNSLLQINIRQNTSYKRINENNNKA